MTVKQIKSVPNAIQTTGDPNTGDVFLHFRNPDESVITVQLTPDLIEIFLRNLSECLVTSPVEATNTKGQLFAVRNITAQTAHNSLVTLRYETEVGIKLETSIDPIEADNLRKQLQNALSSIQSTNPPKAH